ncbi:MAG: bifunctional metallophosphatase/5'-nucleotidase [Armatimonadota bacterium]
MSRLRYGWLLLFIMLSLPGMAVPVRILATGDMHGWLKGRPIEGYQIGGPGVMLASWKQREEYAPGKYLVVSCGDNVAGLPMSTLLEGEADIEVMKAMGYQASALGGQEFAFGRGQLLRLETQAGFPFLAANLQNPDGTIPEVAKPYAIIDTQGVKVAVVGLANRLLPTQANIGIIKVSPYAEALRKYVPEARAKGAQVVIVISSLPMAELVALARSAPELRIPVMLGGTTHEFNQQYVPDAGTWVMNNGEKWAAYGRIDLEVDPDGGVRVEGIKQVLLQQRVPAVDPAIQAIVERWQQRLGPDYTKAMGSSTTGLWRSTGACAFTLQCWLAADQIADFAMINTGGIRQDITAAGGFTKADIINALPFDDKLYRVKMTGQQLLNFRSPKGDGIAVSGLRLVGGKLIWARANQPIDEKATYKIILDDYLYNVSEDLKAADPAPVIVFPDWRIPLYRWLDEHVTTDQRPVEKAMLLDKVVKFGETGMIQ